MNQPNKEGKKRGRYRSYLHEDVSPSKVPKRTRRRHNKKVAGHAQMKGITHNASNRSEITDPQMETLANTDNDIMASSFLETSSVSDLVSACHQEPSERFELTTGNEPIIVNSPTITNDQIIHEFLRDEDWEKLENAVFDTDDMEDNEEKGEKDEEEEDESDPFLWNDEITDDDHEDTAASCTDPPLYTGSPLTVSMHIVAILTFAMAQSLSATAMGHLLVLIYLHCPTPNNCVKTIHKLWSHFKSIKAPIEWHYLCSKCKIYLGNDKPLPAQQCNFCKNSFINGKFKSWETFITFPIIGQLQSMLESPSFVETLKTYRFKHEESKKKRNVTANIEDIIDGKNYQNFFQKDGFLRNPNNLSFQLNTDGVALFKSSSFSIWPVYLVICDLPPRLRYSRKCRLFAGLWFGYTKPIFSTFLKPFKDMFQQLYDEGFKTICKLNGIHTSETWHGIVISSSMDAPAKCLYMCMKQFNGECGCPYCKAKGQNVRTEAKGNCRIYNYIDVKNRKKESPLRNHDDFLVDAKTATDKKKAGEKNSEVNGVRGTSMAFGFPGYDIVAGTAIDYMHAVLLGIMKQLLTYWFDKKYRKSSWYCGGSIKICDARRASIKPPNQVSRIPRSLEERTHYKASELRTWLLYYSLPVMQGILPNDHHQHLMLLVCAIYILLKQSISPQDLNKARAVLEHFCLRASSVYNERFQTFNLHQLLHLTDCVENNGPLWACSCFFFEDLNGDLRSLFHGSQNVEEQIIHSVSALQHIPEILEQMQDCPVKTYCSAMINKKEVGYITETIDLECKIHVLGTLKKSSITNPDEIDQLQIAAGNTPIFDINYNLFDRLKIDRDIIHSKSYHRVTKRNSTIIEFKSQDGDLAYASIKYFVSFKKMCTNAFCNIKCNCKVKEYICMLEEFEKDDANVMETSNLKGPRANITHLIPVKRDKQNLSFIFVNQIIQSCFLIDTGTGNMYVGIPPNRIERE